MEARLWIGYIAGTMMCIVGALVLAGFFEFRGMMEGDMLRITFGIVMVLFGIFRISMTTMQRRRMRDA